MLVIGLSRWAADYWYLMVPAIMLDGVAFGLLHWLAGDVRWLRRTWCVGPLVAAFPLIGWSVVALLWPLLELLHRLR